MICWRMKHVMNWKRRMKTVVRIVTMVTYITGSVLAGHVILAKQDHAQPPNLHLLGELFLGCGLLQAFDITLVLQFVALLISYSLAGSEAYAQVLGINYLYVIPVFVWVLSFLIVFALQLVQPVVSILTFFKGSLLLGTVAVTFYVGAEIHRDIHNDFSAFGGPFLMGTVALGGVANTMPLMYSKISPVKDQIQNFRLSVNLGLITCTVLNILWCWAVLDIVPQLSSFPCPTDKHSTDSEGTLCYRNISLQRSASEGEISTIPLTKIIKEKYPTYSWVAFLVELFIMVSITVSFLTVGAVLHHTLLGWLQSAWKKDKLAEYRNQNKVSCFNTKCFCSSVVSLVVFSIVFGVSMLDPQGFVEILEKFSSFTINIEVAVFIFLMCLNARKKEHLKHRIPLPIPSIFGKLLYLIPLYFGFAVIYDVGLTIYIIVEEHVSRENYPSSSLTSPLPVTSSVTTAAMLNNVSTVTYAETSTSIEEYITNVFNKSGR
ncbi:uncharacterized protein LOC125658456 isoform X2 [Ostrea edulis]|uniref:uncharacterized protein LOC125658456 isoform X2 n=1 Tax=Ostrea edulis TaxID=37623 RepID=UPI0024AEB694|nr:uncharacterized protein LOC125658456 isoform X2 [Ostrea edulis]